MALELGIDAARIAAWKASLRRLVQDPERLRFAVCAGVFGLGMALVLMPRAGRLDELRRRRAEAAEQAAVARELRAMTEEIRNYDPRAAGVADPVDWGNYVIRGLNRAEGVKLLSLEPKKGSAKGPFQFVELEFEAEGSFQGLVDLVDRLERGERLLRFERLSLERVPSGLILTCLMKGLVKPGASAVEREP